MTIPYSVLDLATVLEGKSISETYQNSLRLAQHCEQLGYKRFWLAEHHNMESIASAATSVLIGHIAQGTKSIRVGSGGIMLPNHSPLVIAEQFGTLGYLFPGRIDLGLGRAPGTDQLTAMALRRDRFAGYDFPEQVQELLRYFSPDNKSSKVRAIPGEGLDIPVWILGSSTDSAYLAAEFGLPYAFASHFAPTFLMEALRIYRDRFKPSQFLQQPYSMAAVNIVATESNEEAELVSTSLKRLFAGVIRGVPKPLPPPGELPVDFLSTAETAVMESMMTYSFRGDQQSVKQKIEAFISETSIDELMVVTHAWDQEVRRKSYELIVK